MAIRLHCPVGALAIVCNINLFEEPNDAVQRPTHRDSTVFADEYLVEAASRDQGWLELAQGVDPQPDEDWMTRGYPPGVAPLSAGAPTRGRGPWVAFGRDPLDDGALARDVLATIYGAYVGSMVCSDRSGRRVDLRPNELEQVLDHRRRRLGDEPARAARARPPPGPQARDRPVMLGEVPEDEGCSPAAGVRYAENWRRRSRRRGACDHPSVWSARRATAAPTLNKRSGSGHAATRCCT